MESEGKFRVLVVRWCDVGCTIINIFFENLCVAYVSGIVGRVLV